MNDLPQNSTPAEWEPTSAGSDLPIYRLTKLFPFYLAFNRAQKLVEFGEWLQRLCPQVCLGDPLKQHFKLELVSPPLDFDTHFDFDILCEQAAVTLRLEYCQTQLQFQGQVVPNESKDIFLFLGLPWVNTMEALKPLCFKLSGNSSQSYVVDFLLLLQARTASLSDIRCLAEKLSAQRLELSQALEKAELAMTVLEQSVDAIEVTDAEGRLLYVNSAFEKITGFKRDEVLGKTPASLFRAGQHNDDFYDKIWQTIASGQVWRGSCIGRRKDGSFYHQDTTIFPVQCCPGEITHYVSVRQDVSDRQQSQKANLQHSVSLLEATFEATADGILVTDSRGKILNFNRKFIDLWCIPETILASRSKQQALNFIANRLKDPKTFSTKKLIEFYVRPQVESYQTLELRDGRILEQYSCPQRLGDAVIGWVWSFRDITERQRHEAKIRHQASHDALTGLPNRPMFNEQLATDLHKAHQAKAQLAVCFLDLDRFKLINDTLGHAMGDRLLQTVASRLQTCLRSGDFVARWAGDEFTLLFPNVISREAVAQIAQRVLDAFKPPIDLDGHQFHPTLSVGIALYPDDGEDAETLIKNADAALYRVKASGRNGYQFYAPLMNSQTSALLSLESALHKALERNELVVYYQPLIHAQTGEIIQMEALLRWQHPDLGLLPPAQFIPLAEETGLIDSFGEWVLRTACAQNAQWQAGGMPRIRVGVNLSARQLRNPQLVKRLVQILDETGLEAGSLELEITETVAMQNVDSTRTLLDELHQLGVHLSLDDFGTGYSSMSYLKDFPLHTIKIDKSFIQELTSDAKAAAIVTALIVLGKGLNLQIVAEGVETEAQYLLLCELHCQVMQGFFFSHPLLPVEATKLLGASLYQRSAWYGFDQKA